MTIRNYKEILCTLGPSSLNKHVINRLTDLGVSLFRINLSHTSIDELPVSIETIKKHTNAPICIDTEGAQIRTGQIGTKLYLEDNDSLYISKKKMIGGMHGFNLYPDSVYDRIEVGDFLIIDFNSVMVQIIEKSDVKALFKVVTGGSIQQNKAVTIRKNMELPPLTEKDIESINVGIRYGIKHFALSFANSADDVEVLRSIIGTSGVIISKIESKGGILNLDSIAKNSDAILIDRGDLSHEVSIENIPVCQKHIIKICKSIGTKVYVATNLLESMINSVVPTRAEVNDIHNTLCDGADGLVLAAETAIGKYPIQCTTMIRKMITQYEKNVSSTNIQNKNIIKRESLVLPEPHGGELITKTIEQADSLSLNGIKSISVDLQTIMDAEQIAIGTFSPLSGFMDKAEITSVLDNYSLTNGIVWPMPIFIQISEKIWQGLTHGETIALKLNETNDSYAKLTIRSKFKLDLNMMSNKMFRTNDNKHPGVARLLKKGNHFISGEVELQKRLPSQYKHFEITPAEAREVFENKGWSRVVGFHTRNIPHRVHEHIQLSALKDFSCDGLFIHPVIGPKKPGDYLPEIIMNSYQLLVKDFYFEYKPVLGAFQNYSRYAGPREAIFTAICRKNFGCSHFIVGRDHTGVGNYYSSNDLEKLLLQIGDIGITPILLDEYVYAVQRDSYIKITDKRNEKIKSINGTYARELLQKGERPPSWYMREEISNYIINVLKLGKKVFVE